MSLRPNFRPNYCGVNTCTTWRFQPGETSGRSLLRDYEPSGGPSIEALVPGGHDAVDEEVDAGVGEEEEMGHGLRVQEVGGRVVDRVALDAAHLITNIEKNCPQNFKTANRIR